MGFNWPRFIYPPDKPLRKISYPVLLRFPLQGRSLIGASSTSHQHWYHLTNQRQWEAYPPHRVWHLSPQVGIKCVSEQHFVSASMPTPRPDKHEAKPQLPLGALLTPRTGQIRTWGPGERPATVTPAALPPLPRPVSRSSLNNPPSDNEDIEDMGYGASLARVNANTDWTRNQNQHKQERSDHTAASEPDNGGLDRSIRSAAMRFLLIIKTVLFSSVVNVLLVFVPVGIAVRMSSTALSFSVLRTSD